MGPRLRTVTTLLLGGLLFLAALGVPGCDSGGVAVPSSSVSTTRTTQPTTTSSIVTTTMPSIVTAPSSTTTTVERIEFYTADWGYDRANVSYLAGRAEVIVRGRVAGEPTACWNSTDGKQWMPKSPDEGPQFYTTWTVAVEEVLKGTVAAGDLVPFRFVGGTVEFNGRYAHYVGNDYPEMLAGDEVIIFGTTETRIQNTSDLPGYWILAGFAVFRLDESGRFVRMVPGYGPEGTDQTTIEAIKYFVDHPGEAAALPSVMPADFGFRAAYGVTAKNDIDTFAGTFTKDLVLAGQATTDLRLTGEEMQSLYRDLVEMHTRWQLFTTPFSVEDAGGFVTPSVTYRLEWSGGDFSAIPIVWDDSNLSSDPKAVALRDWFDKLRGTIEAKPEYEALPPAEGGYD